MANYRFDKRKFIIEDFQRATPFCSFLPAVAGKEGKPIWAFYASVGQAMGGFGATSKQTPIVPFDSAHLAYENIGIRGFRTFLKFGDLHLTPFFGESTAKRNMETSLYDLKIEEIGEGYTIAFTYSGIPHESFPGLIRKMELTNTSDKTVSVSGVDGLPIFFPLGLSNGDYKQLVSLMEAYCEVNGLGDRLVFAKFKTSTGDNSVVALNEKGNGYFAKDQDGRLLLPIADPAMVFGDDLSLLTAKPFFEKNYSSFTKTPQQRENKLPSAFFAFATTLKPGETYTAYEVFGSFVDEASFREAESRLGVRYIETLREQNEELVTSLVGPAYCHSGNETFDLFVAQSYLDNNLRGGFPSLIAPGVPYYLYGRKHGDLERDYNDFVIPASYYSSGPGNFRDVNQNRRNDLFFAPFVGDYNIRLFYSLIQIDGQNPLNVKPETFVLSKKDGAKKFLKKVPSKSQEGLNKVLSRPFEPREVLTYLIDEAKGFKEEPERILTGGPMMGIAQYNLDVTCIKGTNAVLCLTKHEAAPVVEEEVCLRCGRCVNVCPMHLTPVYMHLYAEKGMWKEAEALNVLDCIECGSCNYICPARIHLVQSFRVTKGELRNLAAKEKAAKEAAKA